jgi:nucleotide-binding universal stress UspA family protein
VFERIIVTLDGSASSEAALPAAEELARRLGSSLVLLHVIEARPPKAIHGERHLATVIEAEGYLAPIVARIRAEGLRASAHVHDSGEREPGDTRGVAASVAAHEAEFGNDLAVMAAHGRHGLSEVLSGSLPLKVAASGGAAVLLVSRPIRSPALDRSGEATAVSAPTVFAPRRLLLPLDGRSEHEAALPAATALASAFGLDLRLIAVVPRSAADAGGPGIAFARIAPALSGASLEYAAEGEERYLADVAGRLAAKGLKADWKVIRGRPVKTIIAAAEEGDLIVLSSHRRIGLDASLDGCVAFGVAQAWEGAMLIVPVPKDHKP